MSPSIFPFVYLPCLSLLGWSICSKLSSLFVSGCCTVISTSSLFVMWMSLDLGWGYITPNPPQVGSSSAPLRRATRSPTPLSVPQLETLSTTTFLRLPIHFPWVPFPCGQIRLWDWPLATERCDLVLRTDGEQEVSAEAQLCLKAVGFLSPRPLACLLVAGGWMTGSEGPPWACR